MRRLCGLLTLATLSLAIAALPLRWSSLALAAAILVTLVLLQPALGLVVLAFSIPFGQAFAVSTAGVSAVDGLVALVLAAWLLQSLASHRLAPLGRPLVWPLAIFLWLAALSLLQAVSLRLGALEWLKWAEFAAVYFLAAVTLRREQVRWVLIALFAAAIIEVGLGIHQFSAQAGPDAFAAAGGFVRAYGTLRQPNPYAGYLGYLMPVAFSLTIGVLGNWWKLRTTGLLLLGLLLALVTLVLLVGIALSWSRGAWLATAAAGAVVLAARNRRSLLVFGILLLVIAVVLGLLGPSRLPGGSWQRIVALGDYFTGPNPATVEITDQNFSVLERIAHWQAGLRMFESAPWTGVGIGNYDAAYSQFSLPHWYDPLGHAHNLYINFLAETGVLGAAAFLLFWVSAAVFAVRQARTPDPLLRPLAIGILGSLVYLTIHNLFDNLFVQHLQLQLALLLGAVATLGTPSVPTFR